MPGISKPTFRRISSVVKWMERSPRRLAPIDGPGALREQRWFYTTSPMTTAAISGTDINSALLTLGQAQARMCLAGNVASGLAPDVSSTAQDVTIYNGVVISASVPAGCFYKCSIVNGLWVADLSSQC